MCAIVVTYRPDADVPAHIEAIRRQVARVIVVDNEASAGSRARLAGLREHPTIEVMENRENRGIAAAFNQGVQRALTAGFEWVATFDQDSHAPDGYIAGLLAAHAGEPARERVAVVAPIYRDRQVGFIYSPAEGPLTAEQAQGNVPVRMTASSGNLVSTKALRKVGGFREDFFMACVDVEFCLRCREAGWLILEVRSVRLDHAMGRYREESWLWFKPKVNDYDAVRRYYQARNLAVLCARFGWFDPGWALRECRRSASDLVKLLLFCEGRGAKVRAIFRGMGHAMTGRLGRWPNSPAGDDAASRALARGR